MGTSLRLVGLTGGLEVRLVDMLPKRPA